MSLPVHKKLLQLARLAKFMKEQIIQEIFLNDHCTYLSLAKSYLDRSCTCVSYSVFSKSTLADGPLWPTLLTPLPFTTPLQLTSHPSSHHSSLSLLTVPSPRTPPQTTPPRPFLIPLTTPHYSPTLLPQCNRNPQQCCGDDRSCLINLCSVTSLPEHKTVLQLDRLAKFIKEQFMLEILQNYQSLESSKTLSVPGTRVICIHAS